MAESRRSELRNFKLIRKAIENGDLNELRKILEGGWDVNKLLNGYNPQEPLLHAIIHRKNEDQLAKVVELLMQHGANPNITHRVNIGASKAAKWIQRPLLHEAIIRGPTELVKLLLDAGDKCTTSASSKNRLVVAVRSKLPAEMIKLLLEYGSDPNDHDDQPQGIPLLKAIRNLKHVQNDTTVVQLLLKHGANPNVSHRVNIGGCRRVKWVNRTALYEAVETRHTPVVQILLEAGAKITTSDVSQNPLAMAVGKRCPPDLIVLLLKHGADPNDHDDQLENIPLLNAINYLQVCNNPIALVELLLEHGANPDVAHTVNIAGPSRPKLVRRTAIHEAVYSELTEVVRLLFKAGAQCTTSDTKWKNPLALALQNTWRRLEIPVLLMEHGADVNCKVAEGSPFIHRLVTEQYTLIFLQQELDLFFLHGGNINMEDSKHRVALELAVGPDGNRYTVINSVRWLIRHGAEVARFANFKYADHPAITLILLQAGMRVSHGAQKQLSDIAAWHMDDTQKRTLLVRIQSMYGNLCNTKDEELCRLQGKSTFPKYLTYQMADLQEFSDESLQIYGEDTPMNEDYLQRQQRYLKQIQTLLEFVSQPLSLQWHCRRCVRENLVSLQPSVVKTLPAPSRFKRFIMCHEL